MVDANLEKILNKKYQLLSQLGEGAMGIVYRAVQFDVEGRPQREVAIKVIKREFAEDPTFRQRFLNEVNVTMRLRNRHVVIVHDSDEDEDGYLYYVMELVEGRTLKALLQTEGPLTAERTIYIAQQICEALAEAHGLPEAVVHRDLKPANIFVGQRLDPDWIKIADFGIAKVLGAEAAPLTATGIIGSPRYMAPEQWRGESIDPRTDLYAFGVVLYEMLSGRAPFSGAPAVLMRKHLSESPPPLPSTLPTSLCSLIRQLLAKEPADRPCTALAVRQELARSIGKHQEESPSCQADKREGDQEETQRTPPVLPLPDSKMLLSEINRTIARDAEHVRPLSSPLQWLTVHSPRLLWAITSLVVGVVIVVAGVFGWHSPSAQPPAVYKLLQAAEQGDVVAQFNLGVLYAEGKDIPQDFQKAIRWYTEAAERGNTDAQNNLGSLYAEGKGKPQDFHEAARWYQKAAEKGNAAARNNLGTLYDQGQGVSQDPAEAERWWRQAAEQRNAAAQYNLGVLYEQGRRGESPNYTEAGKWYHKAAEQGSLAAQTNLGRFYEYGLGVTKDLEEASRWYRKAAAKGDAYAQEHLKKLHGTNDAAP